MSARRPKARAATRKALCVLGIVCATIAPASAQRVDPTARIENQVAVFAALDKVTARISRLEVPLGETVKFGALKVTPRACFTRPPTELPKTTTFVEVEEIQLDGQEKRIFSGWMFAESPGLNAVEHPVFDVRLTDCSKPRAPAQAGRPGAAPGRPGAASGAAPTQGWQPVQPGQPGQAGQPAAQPPAEGEPTRRRPPR